MHKRMYQVAALVVLLTLGVAMAVQAAGTTVSMVDGSGDPTTTWKFDPADISVAAGSVVTWQNKGQQPHTVTADDGSFKSDYIAPGGTYQHTFATAGDFTYHCEPHPWMKAVIHVTGGSTPVTAATTTTAPGASTASTTATTAKPGTASTSTTATTTAPGGATTSTTAPAASGGTTTTTVASTGGASSAAPPTDNSTTTTTPGEHQSAASRGGSREGKTDVPQATLAGVLTVLLAALTLRLLSAKS